MILIIFHQQSVHKLLITSKILRKRPQNQRKFFSLYLSISIKIEAIKSKSHILFILYIELLNATRDELVIVNQTIIITIYCVK
jgi:hypothetical protein